MSVQGWVPFRSMNEWVPLGKLKKKTTNSIQRGVSSMKNNRKLPQISDSRTWTSEDLLISWEASNGRTGIRYNFVAMNKFYFLLILYFTSFLLHRVELPFLQRVRRPSRIIPGRQRAALGHAQPRTLVVQSSKAGMWTWTDLQLELIRDRPVSRKWSAPDLNLT